MFATVKRKEGGENNDKDGERSIGLIHLPLSIPCLGMGISFATLLDISDR